MGSLVRAGKAYPLAEAAVGVTSFKSPVVASRRIITIVLVRQTYHILVPRRFHKSQVKYEL